MPDIITAQERQAIDAAVSAGMVKKIPRGKSAFELQYDADTKTVKYRASGASEAWRRSTNRGAAKMAQRRGQPKSSAKARRAEAVAKRVKDVGALVDKGMHRAEIMAVIPGLTEAQLTYAFRQLGVAPGRNVERVQERRKRVAEMVDEGTWTGPAICAELEISRAMLAKDLAALGKKLPRAARRDSQKTLAKETQATRDRITALAAKGMGRQEIADATGLAVSTIRRHTKVMGITLPRKSGGRPDPKVAERRARVATFQAEGLTVREIADRMGRCPKATRKDLDALGLKAAPAQPDQKAGR